MIVVRRRRHRWIAAFLAFALAFSQVVLAAHACPLDAAAATPATGMGHAHAMPDCDGMPPPADSPTDVCATHCLVGQQVQNDDPVFAHVVVTPLLVVRAWRAPPRAADALVGTDSPLPTPPPLLRFSRLLI
jgi:hypothetical protein